jgi:hypothetical protein
VSLKDPRDVRPAAQGFWVTGAYPSSLLTDRSVCEHDFLPVDHEAGGGIAEVDASY